MEGMRSMLERCQADLTDLERKLEKKLEGCCVPSTNPAKLVARMKRFLEDSNSVRSDLELISETKKALVESTVNLNIAKRQKIRELEVRAGINENGISTADEATIKEFDALSSAVMKENAAWNPSQPSMPVCAEQTQTITDNTCRAGVEGKQVVVETVATSYAENNKENVAVAHDEEESDVHVEDNQYTGGAITESMFQSVSNIVRGRSKLADVNKLYDTLKKELEKKDAKKQLTIPEIEMLGEKVTGQTGEAKLSVLRSLRLISITRQKGTTLIFLPK